ncbi:phosphatidylinositol 4-kinase, partial [Reticulomyxa filosa]
TIADEDEGLNDEGNASKFKPRLEKKASVRERASCQYGNANTHATGPKDKKKGKALIDDKAKIIAMKTFNNDYNNNNNNNNSNNNSNYNNYDNYDDYNNNYNNINNNNNYNYNYNSNAYNNNNNNNFDNQITPTETTITTATT